MAYDENKLRQLEVEYKSGLFLYENYIEQRKQIMGADYFDDETASPQTDSTPNAQEASVSQAKKNTSEIPLMNVSEIKALEYHVSIDGKEIGVFKRDALIEMARSGEIDKDAMVYFDGIDNWIEAGNLPVIEDHFPAVPPPGSNADKRRKAAMEAKLKVEEQRKAEEKRKADEQRKLDEEARRAAEAESARYKAEAEAARRRSEAAAAAAAAEEAKQNSYQSYNEYTSEKSQTVLIVLAVILGGLGIDRFYAGRIWLGIFKIGSSIAGVGFIWWIIDAVLAIAGKQKDADGYYIRGSVNLPNAVSSAFSFIDRHKMKILIAVIAIGAVIAGKVLIDRVS